MQKKYLWLILIAIAVILVGWWLSQPAAEPVGSDGLTDSERTRLVAETSADSALGDGLTAEERVRIIAETSATPNN